MSAKPNIKEELGFTDEEWKKITSIEQTQKEFHEWLKNNAMVSDYAKQGLKAANYDDCVKHFTQMEQNAKARYNLRRGWRKWSGQFQSFAEGANRFMKDFAPVIDVAQKLTAPYGALATGTVCVLFTVAENKSKTDDAIASAISGIQDRMPGFQMYQEMYNGKSEREKRLQRDILLAYTSFIEVAIVATKYYIYPGKTKMNRWWGAPFDAQIFEKMASDVQKLIVAIRQQCEELLSLEVCAIKQQNEELKKQISKLQDHNDRSNLMEIQQYLQALDWTLDNRQARIDEYRQSIIRECDDDEALETMEKVNIRKYKSTAHFQEWEVAKQSSILLLIGSNHKSVMELRHHCWMSPLALHLMENSHEPGVYQVSYAFQVFGQTSLYTAVEAILFQLLECVSQELSKGSFFAVFMRELKKYSVIDVKQDSEAKLDALKAVLKVTSRLYKRGEVVYIILDRVDRCEEEDRVDFFETIMCFMKEAVCFVKLFAVANKLGWDITEKQLKKKTSITLRQIVEKQKFSLG